MEWHHPDRVARQFGYVQSIPYDVDARMYDTLHSIAGRRGKVGNAWLHIHARYIDMWNHKDNFVVQFENGRGIGVTPEYWGWYMIITWRLKSPSRDVHLAYDVDNIVTRMFQYAMRITEYDDPQQMYSLR